MGGGMSGAQLVFTFSDSKKFKHTAWYFTTLCIHAVAVL